LGKPRMSRISFWLASDIDAYNWTPDSVRPAVTPYHFS